MRWSGLTLVAFATMALGAVRSVAGPDAPRGLTSLDQLILDNMEGNRIPGLAACAIWEGDVIWSGSYGYADLEHGLAVTDSTLFMLASVSKTVTGSAVMQLWEDGLLDLDDDIDAYLPFEVDNPWHPGVPITFRMLLTHTSSIRDDRNVLNALTVPGDSPIPLGQFLESYLTPGGAYYDAGRNFNTSAPPGGAHEYCNVAFALIGYLVERITDSDFATRCREQIFDDLDMEECSWFLVPLDTTRVARPYRWLASGYVPFDHYGYPFYPAGQLRSSALELARFVALFTEGGLGVLEPETVEVMLSVQYPPDQGFIWFRTEVDGHVAWYHTGGHFGVSTHVLVVPSLRKASVILTNAEASVNVIRLLIWNYILSEPASSPDSMESPLARLEPGGPNPFRRKTVLCFRLEREMPVALDVYDCRGRCVAVLLDALLPAGAHTVPFEAGGLESGVYWCRLSSDGRASVQKLTVVR